MGGSPRHRRSRFFAALVVLTLSSCASEQEGTFRDPYQGGMFETWSAADFDIISSEDIPQSYPNELYVKRTGTVTVPAECDGREDCITDRLVEAGILETVVTYESDVAPPIGGGLPMAGTQERCSLVFFGALDDPEFESSDAGPPWLFALTCPEAESLE
ncbi:MAG: hypothetical protein ACRBI6_12310 [Acidimicrobiales bacterium]